MQDELQELLAPFAAKRGAVIPILQKVQEKFGYVSKEAMAAISQFLGISESELFGVLTFYAHLRIVPAGKHMVRVCGGTSCHLAGGPRIRAEAERVLGIEPGQTTPDGEYSLEIIACAGACALAPTMVIDKEHHGDLTTGKVVELLSDRGGGEVDGSS